MKRIICIAVFVASLIGSSLPARAAADYVWVEGEQPTSANVKWNSAASSHADWLSGGHWLTYSVDPAKVEQELPADGALFEYALDVAAEGKHELWARLGFEFARSAFDWKLDGGEWKTVTPDELTSDAMELDFFAEAAWLKLADVQVGKGKHTLVFRMPKSKNKLGKYEHVLFGLDCVCLSAAPFYPHSRYKPDEAWRTEKDESAAKNVFQFPAQLPEQRQSLKLGGLWEVCRNDEQSPGEVAEPIKDFPVHPFWSAIEVPGDRNTLRPDLLFAHRLWYRTQVFIPNDAAGKSFFIVFPQNNLNTTVYVNGVFCGFDKNPLVRVQIDVSKGIKAGQVNEIRVGIRDAWYGRTWDPNDPMKLRRTFNVPESFFHQGFQELAYPIWNQPQSGILLTPTLVSAGAIYVSDVFVKPSVAKKNVAIEVTLVNNSGRAKDNFWVATAFAPHGEPKKLGDHFKEEMISLAAGECRTIEIVADFPKARLWWPDDPYLYDLWTVLWAEKNELIDVSTTTFGFREWTIDGIHFKLNGVPFHGWCDQHSKYGNPEEWLAFQRQTHQQMMRFWGTKWMGLSPPEALDFFDKNGVVVRRSGALDGEAIGYHADEPDANLRKLNNSKIKMDLLRNWRDQVCAQVREERNHPSIMIWSIENEWLFINCINLYGSWMDEFEAEETKTAEAVQKVDPTRPLMSDGGAACKAQTLPVCGNHYITGKMTEYPPLAYEPNVTGGGRGRWEWDQKRPRFMGEDWYIAGNHPELATLGGEAALTGKTGALPAAGLVTRILQEGYRFADYGGWDFWMNNTDADGSQYIAFSPRAVLCPQWNWTFAAGQIAHRTFGIFNDTHDVEPCTFTWTLNVGGKKVESQSKQYSVAPGTREIVQDVALSMPQAAQREEGELILSLSVGDKEVFRDVKAVSVLPAIAKALAPSLAKLGRNELAVLDPNDPDGSLGALLHESGIAFTPIANLSEIPKEARVLLIGADAIGKDLETSPLLAGWAASGRAVVVLDQNTPLRFQALTAEMESAANSGHAAFVEDSCHPIFSNLQSKDFFSEQLVYRNAYLKPTRGARSLLSCDDLLRNSALVEMPVEKGIMLLSQIAIGGQHLKEAAPRQLLVNMLDYAAQYKQTFRPATITASASAQIAKVADAIGLTSTKVDDPIAAIAQAGEKIAIIEATPQNLAALAAHLDQVSAFTQAGGWIVFNDLTPEGLAGYNKIVGWEHIIRPFKRERVMFPPVRSPLTAGIPAGDVTMYTSKRIFNYQEGNYTVSDEFNYVIDYDEVAPFGKSTFHSYDNIVNGFTNADGWPLIINFEINKDGSPFDIPIEFPKPETFTEFTWIGNTNYWSATKVKLLFEGNNRRTEQSFDVQPNGDPQTFTIDPAPTTNKVTLQIAAWQQRAGIQPLTGIDNIYLKVRRPPEFYKNVRQMLNVGGMMEYPRGKGGIVLCNLLFKDTEEVPANTHKKRSILAAILSNLKAPFSAAKGVIVGGNLAYAPIDISKQANQYRTERGWFGDKRFTFADLPTGKQTLAGVPFDIYDFATSPVPTAIMLGAVGVPNNLAKEVTGIPVHRKADALFFLQAARIDHRRSPRDLKAGEKWEMARYVIHFADGKTAIAPIYSEIDVENYRQEEPKPLPGAQIAWSHKFEGTSFFGVAYSQQWNNPRPDAEIASIDLEYGPDRAGVPALLAITAASGK